jgi:hypothetical protein
MLYGIIGILAFVAGIVAGFFLTARWVRNQMTYNAYSSKPQVKENKYPYDWKADEEFLAIIDNYKRSK